MLFNFNDGQYIIISLQLLILLHNNVNISVSDPLIVMLLHELSILQFTINLPSLFIGPFIVIFDKELL